MFANRPVIDRPAIRRRPRRWRLPGILGILGLLGFLAVAGAMIAWIGDWRGEATEGLAAPPETSTLLLDRDGQILRAFTVADGRWRLPVRAEAVDPLYLAMLIAIEDRRFARHPGVDVLAVARAAWQGLRARRIVSGASTLSMQVARLRAGLSTRAPLGKLRQMRAALALERRLDKAEILDAYLVLAPFGGNLEGVRAATLAWFGKEPRRLTPAEAALLVALPQAPEARRPDRDPHAARRARDRVLDRAVGAGVIDAETAAAAKREPIPRLRQPLPLLAPHLTARLRPHAVSAGGEPRLTLHAGLQRRLQILAGEQVGTFGDRVSAAILVVDHGTGEVLASVGTAQPFATERGGFLDLTQAPRSPGSTLKPLIYGLAFASGLAHPESLIEDRPRGFGHYAPTNFDRGYQGTVTLRQALQQSLNIPAVALLDQVGPESLLARLRRAGARPLLPDATPPGLAIGLGGLGLTLTDLVRLYGALARGGAPLDLRERLDAPAVAPGPARPPVLDARAAWWVADILAGTPPPARALTRGIAFKTGTSYGYRDAWAIGFDGRHAVGVWVGRPDGAPVPGLAGIEGAAPLLVEVFARLGPRTPLPGPPPGLLVATTAELPPPLRRADGDGMRAPGRPPPLEFAYPPTGARIELGLDGDRPLPLVLRSRGGIPPLVWFADGVPIARSPFAAPVHWTPSGPGALTLSVVDASGQAARTRVFVR